MTNSVGLDAYLRVRRRTVGVCAPLTAEDAQLQSLPEASPAKWHLAHTTWFFETFVLGERPHAPGYAYLFNSYYDAVGPQLPRERRGLASRPSLAEVLAYRADVDQRLGRALVEDRLDAGARRALELGLQHEQQHQELILTDIKHALGTQWLRPAYRTDLESTARGTVAPVRWLDIAGGVVELGARDGFAFDCERPRHRVVLAPYRLAARPVCNAEVLAFIAEDGYTEPRWWLAEGWARRCAEDWRAPLYWERHDHTWLVYTLGGVQELDPAQTACHLSFYEADAIARWAGARLPTEAEWEHAVRGEPVEGHFADDDRLHPGAANGEGMCQLYGDVWEWTRSAFEPYPGFEPLGGALGEYNGKFMVGQLVLRGGSCLTPRGHVRPSYRNFFPPGARWQMTGVRLAIDGGRA